MEALIVAYQGNDFDAAIEDARRRHPEHLGAVIAVPKGLEWLLRGVKPLANNEDTKWQVKN